MGSRVEVMTPGRLLPPAEPQLNNGIRLSRRFAQEAALSSQGSASGPGRLTLAVDDTPGRRPGQASWPEAGLVATPLRPLHLDGRAGLQVVPGDLASVWTGDIQRPASGVIRAILVDEPAGGRTSTNPAARASTAADFLTTIADRFSLEKDHPHYTSRRRWCGVCTPDYHQLRGVA